MDVRIIMNVDRFFGGRGFETRKIRAIRELRELCGMTQEEDAEKTISKRIEISEKITEKESLLKSVENWLGCSNIQQRTMPSRRTIIKLSFVLDFSSLQCNRLLGALGYHPLHMRQASEVVLCYYLDTGKTFKEAIMCIEANTTEQCRQCDEYDVQNKDSSIGVSTFYGNELNEIIWSDSAQRDELFKQFMQRNKGCFGMTYNKIYQYFIDNYITAKSFSDFYVMSKKVNCDNYKGFFVREETYTKRIYDIKSHKTNPSREYIILLLIYHYYNGDKQNRSLREYVNAYVGDKFRWDTLDNSILFDAFVIELSKYSYNEEGAFYGSNKLEQYFGNTRGEVFSWIIEHYHRKNGPCPLGCSMVLNDNY